MTVELPLLTVPDAAAWRRWLADHHAEPTGVWLVLAKKGTVEPTTLTYAQALEEALCHGWIDGQVRRRDDATYLHTRARRIQDAVAKLTRGETAYPQKAHT